MSDIAADIYYTGMIVSTCLLICSELLGWSSCDANSVTQLYKCISCTKKAADVIQENSTTINTCVNCARELVADVRSV